MNCFLILEGNAILANLSRRGGREVEGAPLLREYGVKTIEGSNPSLSAMFSLIFNLR